MFNLKKANRFNVNLIDYINQTLDSDKKRVFLVANVENELNLFSKLEQAIDFIEKKERKLEYYKTKEYKSKKVFCYIEKGLAHQKHTSKLNLFCNYYSEDKNCPQVIMITQKEFLADKSISMENVTVNF